MKKLVSVLLCALLLTACMSLFAFAEGESAFVYVSVANKGALVVTYEKVTVIDIDDDNKLTINDALYAVHKAKYQGGADAGYNYYETEQYGLSIGKLWGDTSGCFGYYLNNASAWSLSDEIKNGDYVYAFVYSDSEYWSDSYTYFDKATVNANVGEEITLTLSKMGYDENWNTVTEPLTDAFITINGQKSESKPDKDGKVTIKLEASGTDIISAVSDSSYIVPPVCTISVTAKSESNDNVVQPGDNSMTVWFVVLATISLCIAFTVANKMKNNEF